MSHFSDTGLSAGILSALEALNFTVPTPVQARAIPAVLNGSDVIGIARTGTGKTLAFGLPLIERLQENDGRALILVPTRELALQVEENIVSVLRKLKSNLRTVCLIGGAAIYNQTAALRRHPRIVIATPGRLGDHVERRNVYLSDYNHLVLDEADRMLDMGFLPDIQKILNALPTERQTLLFSATFGGELTKLIAKFMKEPVRIEVSPAGSTIELIRQEICYLASGGKPAMLRKYLGQHEGPVLVFARTRRSAKNLKVSLDKDGFKAAEIHSDRSLQQRKAALHGFKSGKYRILVATDIAARGIDVEAIELVVNYDLPEQAEDYVHRIGRTGRAGKTGLAVSFATHEQYRDVRDIERLVKVQIPLSESSEAAKIPVRDHRSNGRPNNRHNPRRQGGRGHYGRPNGSRGSSPAARS